MIYSYTKCCVFITTILETRRGLNAVLLSQPQPLCTYILYIYISGHGDSIIYNLLRARALSPSQDITRRDSGACDMMRVHNLFDPVNL